MKFKNIVLMSVIGISSQLFSQDKLNTSKDTATYFSKYFKQELRLYKNPTISKKNLDIQKILSYQIKIDQEKLSTKGLYGYEVPTLYTDPKILADGKLGIAAFAEWYVDDEEGYPPLTSSETIEKLDKKYTEKYGEKKYWYTIYNGIYLDHYVNDKVTLSIQADMYPYSPKIYFPDHFGFWFYFTYQF
jgi:hypothetical protein